MRRGYAIAAAVLLAGCATAQTPPPAAAPPVQVAAADEPRVPPAMQWLYGSGEGGAASIQAWHAFRDHVLEAVRRRPRDSVVLAEGATLASPSFVPCGDRPLAVVLDVDETAIQNLGYERALALSGRASDSAMLRRWQREPRTEVAPMPGAVTALRAVREAGVTVIFNSNRDSPDAAATAATLANAGLGPVRPGETLFMRGDVDGEGGKDGRRTHIASRYCVVAMAGDQLGDFSDLFNERGLAVPDRRRAATTDAFAQLWGNGWFLISNPVYGPGLRGDFDEVFPEDARWTDPQGDDD